MIIREIMHENPITIPTSMKLAEAYKLMNEKNIRHLPVMEGEKLVGIISDRDLRLATSKLAEHPFDPGTEVKQIMSHPVESVMVNEPIESALQLMRELKIGCLPVLEG
ncbi:MAG: CBS domain-containing protein, partial [Methanobacteriota archaeon]